MRTDRLSLAGLAIAGAFALTACNDDDPSATAGLSPAEERTSSYSASLLAPLEPAGVETELSSPQLPPVDPAESLRQGVASYEKRDYTAALEQLQVASGANPDSHRVHYLLGLASWKAGRNAEAESALERATQLLPGSTRTWINLARVRMSSNDSPGALEAADAALAIEPESSDALHQRGRALAGLGRTPEAVEVLARAHEIAPDNGYVANTLGWVLLQAGRASEAVPSLESARVALPDVAYVRNNLGVAYERTGDLVRAADEYRAAVQVGDSGGKATASLARLEPVLVNQPSPPLVAETHDVGQQR